METPEFKPTFETVLCALAFLLLFGGFLLRKLLRGEIDLYDFFVLSSVAIAPAAFVFVPRAAVWAGKIVGVAFPFLVLFGLLFVILFGFACRMTVQFHKLQAHVRSLTQEVALMRLNLSSPAKPKD
jgi:hypothetical protein